MAKDAYYFSHDANARNDEKIMMLRADHGFEGYGIYWVLVEMMFESSETCLYHDKIRGISAAHNIDITVLQSVISTCITEELFVSDGQVFYSESLRRRKGIFQDARRKKSEAGKKGMAKRWGSNNTVITNDNTTNNTVITKDNKGKEIKDSKLNKELYIAHFESLWSLYPSKKDKTKILKSQSKLKELYSVSVEKMEQAIKSYMREVEADRKNGFNKQYKNGATWFSGAYNDYLSKSITDKKVSTETRFVDITEQVMGSE